jgi:opine dehydrogenase
VLGSGNGGTAVAFDFASNGHDVYLYDLPQFNENISAIREAGGILSEGRMQGFAKVHYSGHDLEKVLTGADITFVVGPSYAIAPFARACAPFLKEGQSVVICPGSCGGSIVFLRNLGEDLSSEKFRLAETHTLPYAVRIVGPARIQVYNKLRGGLFLGGLPRSVGSEILEKINPVYPGMTLASNIFQTFLQNSNPILHPPVVLMNAALIERTGGNFMFYEEGVTPAVGKIIEALDQERISIGKALGVDIIPNTRIGFLQGYQEEPDTDYFTLYSKGSGFRGIGAPSSLDHRYLTEDVARGLVLFHGVARKAGVGTPVMDSVITLVSRILQENLFDHVDRRLEEIGLSERSIEEFLKLINR